LFIVLNLPHLYDCQVNFNFSSMNVTAKLNYLPAFFISPTMRKDCSGDERDDLPHHRRHNLSHFALHSDAKAITDNSVFHGCLLFRD